MIEDRFQIGDRVRLVKRPSYVPCQLKEGAEGVVVAIGVPWESYGVDWGRDIWGHSCNGTCPDGHGYFVATEYIELVAEILAPDVSEEELRVLLCGEVRYGRR